MTKEPGKTAIPPLTKVLFIVPNMAGGGAERVILNLLHSLDRQRFLPILVLVENSGVFLKEIPGDIDVITLETKRVRFAICKIIKVVRRIKPDVVMSTILHLNIAMALVKLCSSNKICFIAREATIPSNDHRQNNEYNLESRLVRISYSLLNKIICNCEFMKNDLIQNYGILKEKIHVINNPVNFKDVLAKEHVGSGFLDQDKVNILAVGRLSPEKGFDLLLQAFACINNPRFHLTILGEGLERPRLQQLIESLQLERRVTLAGHQENPFAYMHQADLLVLSSRYEGFPNVVIEANACGTPVVAFDCPGGIREIIVEGTNGWLVQNADVQGLATAMMRAAESAIDRHEIREFVRQRYDVNNIARQYENVFMG